MALKIKAVERKIKFNKNDKGVYRYVMQPELYIALTQALTRTKAKEEGRCRRNALLYTNQCRTQGAYLYGIDSCGAADGQTDAALCERSRGHESAVDGVDTDRRAVLSTFDKEAVILHAEGHALRLVLTERGDICGEVQQVS